MKRHVIGQVREIPPGGRKVVELDGRSIGVFNSNGRFYALKNSCPHMAAQLCLGTVTGTTLPSVPGEEYIWAKEGEILRCPWHGWEFDMTTGESIFDPFRCKVRTYPVTIEGDEGEAWPKVETFPVTVEAGLIVVHV